MSIQPLKNYEMERLAKIVSQREYGNPLYNIFRDPLTALLNNIDRFLMMIGVWWTERKLIKGEQGDDKGS